MRGWSDPTVRRAVLAVVEGVHSRRDGQRSDTDTERLGRDQAADLVMAEIRRLRMDDVTVVPTGLSPEEQAAVWATVRHAAVAELAALGRLQPLLDDDSVQDININGCDEVWVIRGDGSKTRADSIADTDEELLRLGQRIARRYGREGEQEWSETRPIADVTLTSGHRISLVRDTVPRPTISIRNPDLTLRRVPQLVALGALHQTVAEFLAAVVRFGANVLVAGGTKAGKTTTMRCLLNEIDPSERIVSIEDVRELMLADPAMVDADGKPLHNDVVSFATRQPNAEGEGAFTLSDGLRASKRLNPDRLVVGEVRSSEAAELLDAMMGEAGGSVCTIHASSARAALGRLEYLAAEHSTMTESGARRRVADAIDVVCWQRQDPATGQRYVAEVLEVGEPDADTILLHEVYRVDANGRLSGDGPSVRMRQRLTQHGWRHAIRAVD
ncbi:MAG TPA: ATPase, T2SS/T4P/T4SS family [Dermatophilaceae bacterium]|nr:ATPase, T2SS/T4P/T4SS family [Dermatophilaceae bacterium]